MSYPTSAPTMGKAELAFREAFDRLKRGKPDCLPEGTPVTQNNIAREAGRDPSALKKDRYPGLIREIQHWIEQHGGDAPPSPRQSVLAIRKRNRSLREKMEALKVQRDLAFSLLVEADAKILDMSVEIENLQARLSHANVSEIAAHRTTK